MNDEKGLSQAMKKEIKDMVSEAMSEALKGANIIDGPTHIAHHQFLEENIVLARHAKKTAVGLFIKGIGALLLLGLLAFIWQHRGQ
ncbi:MAG: hypothetical protein LBH65_00460 [Desulfovibrio sp.]|jgi:hypothetical protein|nr:hypothetical protein [Desulfovibrio sp.]